MDRELKELIVIAIDEQYEQNAALKARVNVLLLRNKISSDLDFIVQLVKLSDKDLMFLLNFIDPKITFSEAVALLAKDIVSREDYRKCKLFIYKDGHALMPDLNRITIEGT